MGNSYDIVGINEVAMSDLLIRNIEPELKRELDDRAREHGRSLSCRGAGADSARSRCAKPRAELGTMAELVSSTRRTVATIWCSKTEAKCPSRPISRMTLTVVNETSGRELAGVMSLRLVFMGTPDFAVPTLLEIVGRGHEVVAVYTRAPKPAGRGMELQVSAGRARGAPLRPAGPDAEDAAHRRGGGWNSARIGADAAVVVAYGLILPKPILEAVALGCFNLHASLLPRWRGAAPINRAVMAGDAESGVMVMRMDGRARHRPDRDGRALADRRRHDRRRSARPARAGSAPT